MNPEAIKAALPFREGDIFNPEVDFVKLDQASESIKVLIGHPPTDISPACCDKQGRWMFYIGLSGKTQHYDNEPKGKIRLPANVFRLFEEFGTVYAEGVQKGMAGEDQSKGYALSEYPPARSIQLRMRSYALVNEVLLCDVLKNSSDDQHRSAAAQILGYAGGSKSQINCLIQAGKDTNEGVRNNSTRALWVLAASDPKKAREIPADTFIELILSGKWLDLNKGSLLLFQITRNSDERTLMKLRRKEVIERLIEIARWRAPGYGDPARYMLGRIAGIDEKGLQQLVTTGAVDEILAKLQANINKLH